eukprot:TRINITY_DN2379_c0_g1_i1.p1 TRINITY_DN2379_c0_g1~~TRINITY_DN2379_c0_g1_i1.p1  ORF type:complete len:165 (-),score=37.93 TRINITY_DN2379_c0_g1_i1:126-620(-)
MTSSCLFFLLLLVCPFFLFCFLFFSDMFCLFHLCHSNVLCQEEDSCKIALFSSYSYLIMTSSCLFFLLLLVCPFFLFCFLFFSDMFCLFHLCHSNVLCQEEDSCKIASSSSSSSLIMTSSCLLLLLLLLLEVCPFFFLFSFLTCSVSFILVTVMPFAKKTRDAR